MQAFLSLQNKTNKLGQSWTFCACVFFLTLTQRRQAEQYHAFHPFPPSYHHNNSHSWYWYVNIFLSVRQTGEELKLESANNICPCSYKKYLENFFYVWSYSNASITPCVFPSAAVQEWRWLLRVFYALNCRDARANKEPSHVKVSTSSNILHPPPSLPLNQ